jgi:hypothetical protein
VAHVDEAVGLVVCGHLQVSGLLIYLSLEEVRIILTEIPGDVLGRL